MNIIITGCLGHIGSYIISNLSKINKLKKIYLIDKNTNNKINTLFNLKTNKKIFYIHDDLLNPKKLFKIKNISIVLHLASITNAEVSLTNKRQYFENNLGCFKNVIKFCNMNNSKLIHISSTSIYGDQSEFVDENSKYIKPQSPYAKIKFLEEQMLKKNKKIKYVSLRFGTICGYSLGMRFHTAINKFCLQTILGEKITVWKTAIDQYRPYLSIDDAFKTINFFIKKNLFPRDVFNVLSENLTVRQIIRLINKNGQKTSIKYVNSKIMNQLSYKVDKSKIEKLGIHLNSKIKKDINKTLKSLIKIKYAK
tara:strand:- start:595 stop:1521 length:927 start_codon:yes stop_codon:yes gene_type:complete